MLVIDDNMLKLAKMQEKLLKMSSNNKESNIEQYKITTAKIDKQAFESLLKELEQVNIHNQSLEEELEFLETIKNYYNQLYELQLSFIRVLEEYNSNKINLSDLKQIDIEYINTRIDTINGYLINKKNLETNKKRLEQLSEELVEEERKNKYQEEKLLEYESALRENFLNAEGRTIEAGKLQYISVQSEYSSLGYNLKYLLENKDELQQELTKIELEQNEIKEKLKAAEICYNSVPNSSSKQILNDIEEEFLKIRYRLAMLKILQYLTINYTEYELFKEKRENLLDLIKYRANCLKKLNINISIDPFERTKIQEQLEMINGQKNNAKNISKIKKEIVNLSERVEETTRQNEEYLIKLSNKKIKLTIELTDNQEQSILNEENKPNIKFEDLLEIHTLEDNQVIGIKEPSTEFNMRIVKDKTNSVIKRVNEMITTEYKEEIQEDTKTPELVIVESISPKEETLLEQPTLEQKIIINESSNEPEENEENTNSKQELSIDSELFTTTDPFENVLLFQDKVEEEVKSEEDLKITFEEIKNTEPTELKVELDTPIDEMPEAFWTTQEDNEQESDIKETMPSFDEQIEALLSSDNNNKNLVKKLSA